MKRTISTVTVLFLVSTCLVPAALAARAQAKKNGPLSGAWKCVGKIPDRPDGEFQLDMEQDGEAVTGTGSNAQGNAPLKGTFKDGQFKLTVEAGDVTYQFEGKLEGGKIKGTFAVPVAGVNGTFEGTKQGGEAAASTASLSGAWKCTLKVPDRPEMDGQLDLEQNGQDVKGTGSNANGSAPVKGSIKEGKFKLTVEAGEAPWEFEGQLDGDKISGTFAIAAAGVKGNFEGARKK